MHAVIVAAKLERPQTRMCMKRHMPSKLFVTQHARPWEIRTHCELILRRS